VPLTVRDLVSTPDLGLRLLTDGLDVDQPITWVHVSELIDPTPFPSGGELLLTTGITLGGRVADGGGAELDDYVRRLVAAAVVGVVLVGGAVLESRRDGPWEAGRVPDDLLIARNPDPDSTLPFLIRIPLGERGIVVKAKKPWPRESKVYCHRAEEWPADPEILERLAGAVLHAAGPGDRPGAGPGPGEPLTAGAGPGPGP